MSRVESESWFIYKIYQFKDRWFASRGALVNRITSADSASIGQTAFVATAATLSLGQIAIYLIYRRFLR